MFKSIAIVALLAASVFGGYSAGKVQGFTTGRVVGIASVPHLTAINPVTGKIEPVPTYGGNVQIVVVGPHGMEEGVIAGHTKDGTKVLVLPPSMLAGPDQQEPAEPQANHAAPPNRWTKLA